MQRGLYLISPGIFIPRGELQYPDDLVDLGAHLLKGEPPVPLRLLHTGASAALSRHKDLNGCMTVKSQAKYKTEGSIVNIFLIVQQMEKKMSKPPKRSIL